MGVDEIISEIRAAQPSKAIIENMMKHWASDHRIYDFLVVEQEHSLDCYFAMSESKFFYTEVFR